MSERWVGLTEVAEHTALSERTIRRHAALLGGCKFGGSLRFRLSVVDAAIEAGALDPRRRREVVPLARAR